MTNSESLKDLLPEEFNSWVQFRGYPAWRGQQLCQWVYKNAVDNPDLMHNLPKSLRDDVKKFGNLTVLHILAKPEKLLQHTQKFLFRLHDGLAIESVFIPMDKRKTVCVSSQVGCAMNCTFCQTAKMGFKRNLSPAEIIDQVYLISRFTDSPISNVVFMGMGEPFLNFDNVIKAAKILNHPQGFNIGARHITVSTCGLVPQILQFAGLPHQFKLAVSLNGADDTVRSAIMPVNRQYPLSELIKAVKFYTDKTHRRVTFEYVLIKDVNMSEKDAENLTVLLSDLDCKVNLIPYNETQSHYLRPEDAEVEKFFKRVNKGFFSVTIRKSEGRRDDAACGQLYVHEFTSKY